MVSGYRLKCPGLRFVQKIKTFLKNRVTLHNWKSWQVSFKRKYVCGQNLSFFFLFFSFFLSVFLFSFLILSSHCKSTYYLICWITIRHLNLVFSNKNTKFLFIIDNLLCIEIKYSISISDQNKTICLKAPETWYHVYRVKRIWYLLPMRAAKVQASLRIHAVSPEPPLLAHTSSESRGTFRQ